VLGAQQVSPKKMVIRAFRPAARELYLLDERKSTPVKVQMEKIDDVGLFEASLSGTSDNLAYSLTEITHEDNQSTFKDPYAYPLMLTEFDLYLHAEGRNWEIYKKLGAHQREVDGVTGINFAVWAPNAKRVSVIGDFNNWDG